MEREVITSCEGLYQFLGMVGRCYAIQPAYAQLVREHPRGNWVDYQTFPLFECMLDGNRWAPYDRPKQEQLRKALQSCETHTSTLLQYGPGTMPMVVYCVTLVKRTDGSVVGSQVTQHSGTTRKSVLWPWGG